MKHFLLDESESKALRVQFRNRVRSNCTILTPEDSFTDERFSKDFWVLVFVATWSLPDRLHGDRFYEYIEKNAICAELKVGFFIFSDSALAGQFLGSVKPLTRTPTTLFVKDGKIEFEINGEMTIEEISSALKQFNDGL